MKKRIIYHAIWQDDDLCECESFHDVVKGKLVLITAWFLNDADYRDEYMEPVFTYLGVKIKALPKKHMKKGKAQVLDTFGITPGDVTLTEEDLD